MNLHLGLLKIPQTYSSSYAIAVVSEWAVFPRRHLKSAGLLHVGSGLIQECNKKGKT